MALLGDISSSSGSSESYNNGFGIGMNSGSSYEQGASEYGGYSDSWNTSESNAWSKLYGTEASAKDIERAAEANRQQFDFWKAQASWNADEAAKQRVWQEQMSNTAYQRAVKDLIAAGLNPYLAATNLGGASTPTGGVSSSGLAMAHKAETFPDQESRSHSESAGGSHGENSGSSYNFGGSNQYGINLNISSGKSVSQNESKSEPFTKWLGDEMDKGLNNAINKIKGK